MDFAQCNSILALLPWRPTGPAWLLTRFCFRGSGQGANGLGAAALKCAALHSVGSTAPPPDWYEPLTGGPPATMAEADALNGLRLLWRSAHRDHPAVSGAEYRAFLARFDFQAVAVDEAPKSVTDFQQTVQSLPDVGRNVFLSLGVLGG